MVPVGPQRFADLLRESAAFHPENGVPLDFTLQTQVPPPPPEDLLILPHSLYTNSTQMATDGIKTPTNNYII